MAPTKESGPGDLAQKLAFAFAGFREGAQIRAVCLVGPVGLTGSLSGRGSGAYPGFSEGGGGARSAKEANKPN